MLKKVYGIISFFGGSRICEILINTDSVKETPDHIRYYEKIAEKNSSHMRFTVLEKDIFDTIEQAETEFASRKNIEQKSISDNIKSPEDLVKNMFKKLQVRCNDDADNNYIEVVKKKAKEYFNIEFEG